MGMGSQMAVVMVSVSRVTVPVRARARPKSWTPVVTVIEVSARMEPWNVEPVPSVAERAEHRAGRKPGDRGTRTHSQVAADDGGPVLVTDCPARTEKGAAALRKE